MELNEKIARWCGFKKSHLTGDLGRWKDDIQFKWYYPDSQRLWFLPVFTASIDALFKWVVPKLQEQGWHYLMKNYLSGSDNVVTLRKGLYDRFIQVTNHSPTMAWCLAMEKLIDGLHKEEG